MFNIRRLAPHGIADMFDEAFDLYKANFVLFLCATAIVYLPLQIAMSVVMGPISRDLVASFGGLTPDFDRIENTVAHAASVLSVASTIHFFVTAIFGSAVVYIVAERYHNRKVSLGQGYLQTFRRLLPMLGALILASLLVSIGLLLCVLPGLYLSSRYIVVIQVAILEKSNSPLAIVKRSYALTEQYFWRVAGCVSLLYLLWLALVMATQGAIDFLVGLVPVASMPILPAAMQNSTIIEEIMQSLAGLLVSPYIFAFLTILYYDLRIRQEGYDMTIVAEQLGIAADGSVALPSALPVPPIKRKPWQRKQAA